MWRKTIIILLILFLPNCFGGVEATLENHYLYVGDNLNFHIEIEEDYSGTADLKFCLAEFDFNDLSYNYRCDVFLERHDITFDQVFSKDYSIKLNFQPSIYRLFVQLHYEDKYRKDSDSDNFIYLVTTSEPEIFVYNPRGVSINTRTVPSFVELGEEISVDFNITVFENCSNYNVYSYIYKDNVCVTGNFNTNLIEVELPYSSTTSLTLNNTINNNATIGDYFYKIRVSGCGINFDTKKPIRLIEKLVPFINVSLNDYELKIKNYEETNISYEIKIIDENNSYMFNDSILPHNQKIILLNKTNQFLTIFVNGIEKYNSLLLINDSIVERVIINNTITSNIVAVSDFNEEKSFYILSLLLSIISLTLIYRFLR